MAANILAEPRRFRWMLSRASEAHVGILSSDQQMALKCFCYFKAFTWQKATQFELWTQTLFIPSQLWTLSARIFECDRNFCFDLELKISKTELKMTWETFWYILKHLEAKNLRNLNAKRFLLLPSFRHCKEEFSNVTEISAPIWSWKFLRLTRKWLWKTFCDIQKYLQGKKLHIMNANRFFIAFQFSIFF